ncbi:MAG: HAMP domain-containing sensor histidine kinase [Melioribacteraceae bacterium]
MKEKKIKFIVVLMTLAVIGLLAIQLYWISNLIKVERDRFRRNVFHSLLRVVDRIEREEAAKTVIANIWQSGGKNPLGGKDSAIFIDDSVSASKMVKIFTDEAPYRINPKNDFDSTKRGVQLRVFAYSPDRRSNMPRYVWRSDFDTIVRNRESLIQKVVTEMVEVNTQKKIEERISSNQLNKLLTQEFKSRVFSSEFYFGVYKTRSNSFTLLKKGADTTEIRKSRLRTLLYPAEMFLDRNELVVYFPDEQRQVLSSISGMMVLSVALIFLIAGVFYNTIRLLLRQKKITSVKNDLINNITHEFKTPISTISLACEALNEPTLTMEKDSVMRYSKIIKEENERLKIMVETLLNTAAMEKSEFQLNREVIDIHDVIRSASMMYDEVLKSKEGKIIFQLDASPSFVNCDDFHVTNIIANLLDNAVKYNENKPEITISTRNVNRSVAIKIKDNGIGIPKEFHSKIFDTFYRVQSGNVQNVRGFGIGLSYAKKIAEAHSGSICVKSTPGKGSEFELIFPLEKNQ